MNALLNLLDRLPDALFALAILLPVMTLPLAFCVLVSGR